MNNGRRVSGRSRVCRFFIVAVLLLPLLITGCDTLLSADAGLAKRALVRVSGEGGAPLTVVTSVQFLAFRDDRTGAITASLLGADTLQLTDLPFSQEYNLRGRDRFLVRLLNPDSSLTASVLLEVIMDGKLVYTQQATLLDASLEYITFFRGDPGP
jgi:hypothetical protein